MFCPHCGKQIQLEKEEKVPYRNFPEENIDLSPLFDGSPQGEEKEVIPTQKEMMKKQREKASERAMWTDGGMSEALKMGK